MRRTEAGEAKARAARLKEIRAEMARAAGHSGELPSDVRERLFLASAMKLQFEMLTIDIVNGQRVDADMMLRLSAGIASVLPKPVPQRLEIVFVDGDPATGGRNEAMRLREELAEKDRQLRELRASMGVAQVERVQSGDPAGFDLSTVDRSANVVPMKPQPRSDEESPYAALVGLNAGMRRASAPHLDQRKEGWAEY
jgi:hypothetical protein